MVFPPVQSEGARHSSGHKKAAPEFRGRKLKTAIWLERHLRVDLQDAPIQWHSEESSIGVGVAPDGGENGAKDGAGDAVNWKVEVLVVENIKRGCPNGKSETFADLEVLQDRQVCIEEPGPA